MMDLCEHCSTELHHAPSGRWVAWDNTDHCPRNTAGHTVNGRTR